MTAVLEATGVRAGYGKVEIVRDLNLRVDPGEVVALLGPNGAGKTTTLLTLSGELPALGGEVRFLGDVTTAPLHVRARKGLAVVSQERAVLMDLTTTENLRVSRCDIARAVALFPELEPHMTRRVGLLSGGQQQMLALGALSLARMPPAARRRAVARSRAAHRRPAVARRTRRRRRRHRRVARRTAHSQGTGRRRPSPRHDPRLDRARRHAPTI